MTLVEEQHSFYSEVVPAHFNETFDQQVEKARGEEAAERLLEEMRAVRASIRIEVVGPDAADAFVHLLEIDRGEMRPVASVTREPFLILRHALGDLPALIARCGSSVLGFLGSIAGLDEEMRLTSQRVRSLRELAGTLSFSVEGPEGFTLQAGFGVTAFGTTPDASIRLRPEVFDALRSGEMDPQDAFFDEKIDVEGDLEIAIGASLAALSPD